MTTISSQAPASASPASVPAAPAVAAPERHYEVLDIVHNDNGTGTMEVLFYEDGHTLRYNLWLPDDPSKVDAAVKLAWPVPDFVNKKAASANIKAKMDQFKALVGAKTVVTGDVGQLPAPPATPAAAPTKLGVQKPAS